MPTIGVNSINLYYEVEGPPGAEAVLFLHGLGSSADDWALQAPVFARRFRVIRPDLRAHGRSGGADHSFSLETMADDMADLLGQTGGAPAHVVGLSLGGAVAVALALRHPACARSLTLVNAFARFRPAGWRGLGRGLWRLWLLHTTPMPRVAAYIAGGLFPRPEQRPLYEAAVASLGKNSRQTYLAAIRAITRFNVESRLDRIACPALILAGDRDQTVPRSAQHALQRGIPGAHLVLMPDSGHATPYDQAGRFNEEVLGFVEGVRGEG